MSIHLELIQNGIKQESSQIYKTNDFENMKIINEIPLKIKYDPSG